uniref:BED-type domain-containing protein n=1 Tax=Salix viminalis TaxID=40686 RepID=A0A6N2NIZ0_SALVM
MGSSLEPIPITSQKHDPAWKHCQMFKNGERVQLKCVYCGKIFKGGGIHRIKEHLAGQKGNAATCLQVPLDVRLMMQQSLDGVVVKKRKKQKIAEEITNLNPVSSELGFFDNDVNTGMELTGVSDAIEPVSSLLLSGEDGMGKKGGERKERGRGRGRGSVTSAKAVVTMGSGMMLSRGKRTNDHIHTAIGRFLYDIGASLDAVNSAYFQLMVQAIASGGSEVVVPSYHDLRGWVLKNSVEEVKNDVDKHIAAWARTGCSVLVDQWNTVMGRTLISFLVYCPEGVVFLKSVDASDIIKLPDALYELLKQVVEEIGVRHVLQVITRMEEQLICAGRRLADTFPNLYWAPCAAHCLDLILEDFAKLEWINLVIEQARSITRFVYNHSVVLNMMKRYTFGNDIVEPGLSRFATNFVTLKRMVDLKHNLQTMVTSQEWVDCPYSKKPRGLEMLDLVSDQSFWSSCALITHLTNPLLQVLRLVGSKKRPATGYIYAGMYRAKEAIKKELVKREEYIVYWNIIDHWWEQNWNLPLHAAGFYLNPKFFYSFEGDMPNKIRSGMYDCIEKFVPDLNVQDKIIKEVNSYKNAAGDFGRKMAVRARDTMLPAEWWSTYGGSCPNLVRLATRILGQTCSSIEYKRSQIPFEQLHDTKNCLERQRLSDLVFVQCNLRLRKMVDKNEEQDPISFDSNNILEDWIRGKELCSEDFDTLNWMAIDPPSDNARLLGTSDSEIEDLGAGFDDNEIFNRVKEGEEENVESM